MVVGMEIKILGQSSHLFSNELFEKRLMSIEDFYFHSDDHFESSKKEVSSFRTPEVVS